jgi:hypothetical protein
MARRLLLCFALGACTSTSSTGISAMTCPPDSTLTYANFAARFFEDYCLSCHVTKHGPAFTSQAAIQAETGRIMDATVYTTAMPQGADVPVAERELLGEWLACGAP